VIYREKLDKRLIVNTVFDIWPDALAIRFLTNLAGQLQAEPSAHLPQNNQQYIIATVANQTYWSYTPRALFFASDRFNRWQELSRATSKEADAAMLAELYQTYRLGSLEPKYPDMRLRFFSANGISKCYCRIKKRHSGNHRANAFW
jgi:hypothetical protein